jgi:mannosyltransferase OCH1-like enzyme
MIPLNIFQTWHTKNLPLHMANNIENLQKINPEFKYQLFDDNDCRDFIEINYSNDVLNAFDILKPGAFKADLWRNCILFKYGGIYLDIKFECINNFKLIHLLEKDKEKEFFTQDNIIDGVYNALIICQPKNDILSRCIHTIVKNVNIRFYGKDPLWVTGPRMIFNLFNENEKRHLLNELLHHGQGNVSYNGNFIMKEYSQYRLEQSMTSIFPPYYRLWYNNDIYN